ncbi:unnamed protein product [Symbiodinium natans]|uniref:RWD domain-containing protein n=1 Tax=Symbiodinium natans TaxID=878477 RepID=A0A812UC85_9DINO|nr:unnamed protein product [Symbiodinium natans]
MSNSEQLAELSSLEAIYDGSREVVLELPDLGNVPDEGTSFQAKLRAVNVDVTIWLPPDYLADDGGTTLPLFELSSGIYPRKVLDSFAQELQSLAEPLRGSPVLFSWLEWLRVDARTASSSQGAAALEGRETDWEDDFENDIPTADPQEVAKSANCESCFVLLDKVPRVQLKSCQHSLCPQCAGMTSQVFAANKLKPHCPLANCRANAPELMEWTGMPELWATVSKRVLSSPFKDSIVFCPRCEDRGMDMPVVSSLDDGQAPNPARRTVRCFQCSHIFCAICRSPSHSSSCFDDPSCVVRMAKRRPPLTPELAEKAALMAAEIREEELKREVEGLASLRSADGFEKFRECFLQLHHKAIMNSLACEFGSGVELRPTPLARDVQDRFMFAIDSARIKPAFHGTDTKNYPSIFSRGLLIPGMKNEIPVAHGSAHGLGIYTANVDACWLSRGFCTADSMLVCAVRQDQMVKCVGDAMVVFSPDGVVPLFESYVPPSWKSNTSWATAPALQQSLGKQAFGKPAQPPPAKPAQPSPAKPAPKKSKFLSRLAAKSKKH